MDELEQRLSSALTEMAEEVPPSHNAWAEHHRRLAVKSGRTRRRPALMVAAVAAVAMIAVPVLLLNARDDNSLEQGALPTASSPPPTSQPASVGAGKPSNEYMPTLGEKLLAQPVVVGGVRDGNQFFSTYVYLVERDSTVKFVCTGTVPPGEPMNGDAQYQRRSPDCVPVGQPAGNRKQWLRLYLGGKMPELQGLYVYVFSSQVHKMLLRAAEGPYVGGYEIARTPDFTVYAARMPSAQPPAAYTVRDEGDNVLENG
jgi:hypothetical protein